MRPFLLPGLLLLTLAGCASQQFEKPGTWKLPPTGQGANDANLRAMVANPNDLVAGANEPGSNGAEAVRPIELLLSGHRQPLSSVSASKIGAVQSSAGGGGSTGGSGGMGGQ